MAHIGENIGKFLMDRHTHVECETSFVGIHVVDGDLNAGKSIEFLMFITSYESSSMIFSANVMLSIFKNWEEGLWDELAQSESQP